MPIGLTRMKAAAIAVVLAGCLSRAELAPASQLVPPETLAYLVVPNAAQAREHFSQQNLARLWRDPAMQPFREAFERNIRTDLLDPLEEITRVPWTRLLSAAQGQVTLALVPLPPATADDIAPLLFLELGSSTTGRDLLRGIHQAAGGQSVQPPTPEISGVEVVALTFPSAGLEALLERAFPLPNGPGKKAGEARTQTLFFGSAGGTVVVTTRAELLARAWTRAKQPVDASSPPVPDVVLHCHVNIPRWLEVSGAVNSVRAGSRSQSAGLLSWRGLVRHLGIVDLRSATLTVRAPEQGLFTDLHLAIPASARRGIFKVLEWRAADAGPPPFVAENVMKFSRVRLPGREAWSRLLRAVREADSSLAGIVQLFVGYAGKTEDADFDFEKGIIGPLGDDWISVTLPGSAPGTTDTLYLTGSGEAGPLAEGLKKVMAPDYLSTFLPPSAPSPVRQEMVVAGHPVVSVAMPALPWPWPPGATGAVHFASHHGYLAISTSPRALNEFLSSDHGSSLAASSRYQAAVAALGGSQSGFLAYRDELAIASRMFRDASRAPDFLEGIFQGAAFSDLATRVVSAMGGWMEFHRLPPFETVARHFGVAVRRGEISERGITITTFRPGPGRD